MNNDFNAWPVKTKYVDLHGIVFEIAKKRIKSSFIFPIAKLEEIFGEMWGEFKEEDKDLTPEEQRMFEKFMEWRQAVLDYGNNQIRISENEIYKYLGAKNGKVS